MATVTSAQAGSYDDTNVWDTSAVPTLADDVIIVHAVDITAGCVAQCLSLDLSATLTINASGTLEFADSSDATFNIGTNGELDVNGTDGSTATISSETSTPTNYYAFTSSGTVNMDYCDFKDIKDFTNNGSMEFSQSTIHWHPSVSYVTNAGTLTIANSTFTTTGTVIYINSTGEITTDEYTNFNYVRWSLQSANYTFTFEDFPFGITGLETSNKRVALIPVIGGTKPKKYVTGREGRRMVIRGSFQSSNAKLIKDLRVMNEDTDETFTFIHDEGVINDVIIYDFDAPRSAEDVGERRYTLTLQEVDV